jgi:predicted transcriptional regulator of viral defense system
MAVVGGISKASREQLSRVLRDCRETISVEQAATSLGILSNEASRKLTRWAQQGWVSRVQRGLYVPVPLESHTAEVVFEDPWIIANRLYAPCYIGGWSAAGYWELTEQIFRSVAVFTTRKPRNWKPAIKGTTFILRTIPSKAIFGIKPVWRGSVIVSVSDPTRTVLDLLMDPRLGGGLRPTMDVFRAYLQSSSKDIQLLITYSKRLGNGTIFKRLGFLLERLAPMETSAIEICRAQMSTGNAKLDPSLKAKRLSTRWRLWIPEYWAKEPSND